MSSFQATDCDMEMLIKIKQLFGKLPLHSTPHHSTRTHTNETSFASAEDAARKIPQYIIITQSSWTRLRIKRVSRDARYWRLFDYANELVNYCEGYKFGFTPIFCSI